MTTQGDEVHASSAAAWTLPQLHCAHALASGEHGAHLDSGLNHEVASNEQEHEPRGILSGGLHQVAPAKDEPAWQSPWYLRAGRCPGLHRQMPSTRQESVGKGLDWQAARQYKQSVPTHGTQRC